MAGYLCDPRRLGMVAPGMIIPMKPIEITRLAERDALLARLLALLKADSRVAAVWLHGSLGRGTGDAWSDLDLWVVVFDAAYSDDIRYTFATGALFTEEAPQNAPPGGSYLMSAHDAPTGPHLVDWYFQPLRFASAGESRVVLLDRAPLPLEPETAPTAPETWRPTASEEAANTAALFWAMVLIQAKYIARKPEEDGIGFEGFILSLLRRVAKWKGVSLSESETPNLRNAVEKLNRLRGLGNRMAEAAPEFSEPQAAVERFLETVRESVSDAANAR